MRRTDSQSKIDAVKAACEKFNDLGGYYFGKGKWDAQLRHLVMPAVRPTAEEVESAKQELLQLLSAEGFSYSRSGQVWTSRKLGSVKLGRGCDQEYAHYTDPATVSSNNRRQAVTAAVEAWMKAEGGM